METFDEKNEKLAFNQFSTFVVGAGKFGGKRNSDEARPTANPPKRPPDASISEKTGIDQVRKVFGDSISEKTGTDQVHAPVVKKLFHLAV